MVVDLILHYYKFIPPHLQKKTNFWLCPWIPNNSVGIPYIRYTNIATTVNCELQQCTLCTECIDMHFTDKGKSQCSSSCGEPHLRAAGCHLPYGITQCYLPPDTSECTLPNPSHAGWYSIYLPRRDARLS